MRKRLISYALYLKPYTLHLLFALLFFGCGKAEDPIILLNTPDFDTTPRIIGLTEKLRIKVNQPVNWRLTAGSMAQTSNDTVVFTPPTTNGLHKITLKNQRDPKDSVMLNVMVSNKAEIFRPLQKGSYALVFRHAAADVGVDQLNSTAAEWWKSCDSKLARQLNEQGKKDSRDIGNLLKIMQIPVSRVLSSEYCRCYTTADLMAMGPATQQLKDLTYYVYDEPSRYPNTMKVVNSQPIDNRNSVLIIHAGFSGSVPSPAPLASLNWGDAAVFQLQPNQSSRYVATLQVRDFTDLMK